MIPAPSKYAHLKKDFNDITKKSKIYTTDRTSSFDNVIKDAKKSPGVGRYDTLKWDEKMNKKAKVCYTQKQERIYPTDEQIYISKSIPSSYPAVKLETIKKRSP